MPRFNCSCGASHYLADDEFRGGAGKPFTCRNCGATKLLPLASTAPSAARSVSGDPGQPAWLTGASARFHLGEQNAETYEPALAPQEDQPTTLSFGVPLLGAASGREVSGPANTNQSA